MHGGDLFTCTAFTALFYVDCGEDRCAHSLVLIYSLLQVYMMAEDAHLFSRDLYCISASLVNLHFMGK